MRRVFRLLLLLALLAGGILPSGLAQAQTAAPATGPSQPQPAALIHAVCQDRAAPTGSGAVWRICRSSLIPPVGGLVVYAHGYVPFYAPVAIPEDQLHLPDGTYLPDLITGLGFAFATTSYPRNGLSILEGVQDIKALTAYVRTVAMPRLTGPTYLTGVSEGGLVTTLAVERDTANQFSGGLAACGPIGSFQKQVNYLGDFRVLFDYYFAPSPASPLYLPDSPIWIHEPIVPNTFESLYAPLITAAMAGNAAGTRNLLATSGAAFDPANPATAAQTATGILWYNFYGTNDARYKLAQAGQTPGPSNNYGNPYDNWGAVYRNPLAGSAVVPVSERFHEDPVAAAKLATLYQTTGNVNKPLVTLHTTGDPIVPFWHEVLYYQMALAQGKAANVTPLPVFRYGHCQFNSTEVLGAFGILVSKVTGSQPARLSAQPFDLSRAQSDFARAQAESAKNPALR